MPVDYSEGSFIAYGNGADGPQVATVEDGYVRSGIGTWEFRIDGNEIYGQKGDFVGYIEEGVATRANSGQFLFRLERA